VQTTTAYQVMQPRPTIDQIVDKCHQTKPKLTASDALYSAPMWSLILPTSSLMTLPEQIRYSWTECTATGTTYHSGTLPRPTHLSFLRFVFSLWTGVVMNGRTGKSPILNGRRTKSRVENTTLPFFCVTLINSAGSSSSASDFFNWKTKPLSRYTKASGSPWVSDNSRPS